MSRVWLVLLTLLCLALPARAHDFPRSQVALHVTDDGIAADIRVSVLGLGFDLPEVAADGAVAHRDAVGALLARRLTIASEGKALTPAVETVAAEEEGKFVRVRLRYVGELSARIAVRAGALFPNEPTHQTYVSVYRADGTLVREAVLHTPEPEMTVAPGERQTSGAVFLQFVREGVHHIFIGPDHILFLVGLLLLGGGLGRLLKIITAFTVAHSITLALATFGILQPPARLVEPTIALSIVFVGIHSLMAKEKADLRALFAFGFGLIHGFGFASVLQEMELPRTALGLSLFSFNLGVEIGQACIVLAVAPALGWLQRRHTAIGRRVTLGIAWGVILAGAYWFGQRVAG